MSLLFNQEVACPACRIELQDTLKAVDDAAKLAGSPLWLIEERRAFILSLCIKHTNAVKQRDKEMRE